MKPKGRRIAIATRVLALAMLGLASWLGWPHIVFWYRFESIGVNQLGLREYRHRKTGIVMVQVPGEKVGGAVHVDPFLIGKYPLSLEQVRGILAGPFYGTINFQRFYAETGLSSPSETQWNYVHKNFPFWGSQSSTLMRFAAPVP